MSYTVKVTREGDAWIADVENLPGAHTYAGNLMALSAAVREVIELVADVPEGVSVGPIVYHYEGVPGVFLDAANVGERRAAVESEQAALAQDTVRSVASLIDAGFSQRDIAGVLHMSVGRVSQITKSDLALVAGD